ncbi:MAG: alkaline phosphatase family protein [Candidatus Nitrosocosmicus sp.]|nr:alkaline phosphatase family protein [Candidatus Nitrosocosmicus sp.]
MTNSNNKRSKYFVILDIVGLDVSRFDSSSQKYPNISSLFEKDGEYGYMKPVFPSVTCTVQASILTGKYPKDHGIISNGFFDRENLQTLFWEQSTNLVQSEKIWDIIKSQNDKLKTALLFWQNSMYSNNDYVVTPRPIHLENGQMDMWCYSKPVNYYEEISKEVGEFNLMDYWGPFASIKSSEWITKSIQYTINNHRPNLIFAYFPQLDYSAQKFGHSSPEVNEDLKHIDTCIGNIIENVKEAGIFDDTHFLLLSEYGFNDVKDAISINRILRDRGLLQVRTINGKEYVDYEYSNAFAMVDHQIAHIYIKDNNIMGRTKIKKAIEDVPGIEAVCDHKEKQELQIDHARSGDLIAIADKDRWFSYYWWYDDDQYEISSNPDVGKIDDNDKAPSFTRTVDIHRKPGYDPLDLFIDPKRKCISTDTRLIKGSHGRPYNIESGEGLSAFISSKKIEHIKKDNFNGHPVIDCLDVFDIVRKNFV